jgi:hypothetical protein
MERVLLSVLAIGLSAGQVFGGMYVLDKPTALSFTKLGNSDTGGWPGLGTVSLVAANPSAAYGPMQLQVGFVGGLGDGDGDNKASVTIGKTNLSWTGYDGFTTEVANDNDDPWGIQLYVVDNLGTQTSNLAVLTPGTRTSLSVSLSPGATTITELGLIISGSFVPYTHPSNPDYYHVSVVPVPLPGALLLGMLGLGAAGMKLRRLT